MLSIALIAIDATILATAVPAIVRDLGGFTQFPWMFSAYLLTQAISTPIYGKLADTFGRKPLMLFGIGIFVLGSVLCAVSWSMGALIAFRALQGLGAGAIQPAGMTIMGDIYSVAERAVAQGYIASVWAMSAVIGPTLGGLFSDHLSWRWIFWINVPLGLLAAVVLWIRFDEKAVRAAPTPADRLVGRLPGRRRVGAAAAGPARGRHPVAVVVLAERRRVRRCGAARRAVRPGRGSGRGPGAPRLAVPAPGAQRRDRRRVRRRRRDARRHVLRPRLRAAGARRRRDGGGLRRRGAGDRLAVRREHVGPDLPALGLPRLPARSAPPSARSARRSSPWSGRAARSWLLAAACLVLGVGLGYVVSPSVVAMQSAVDVPAARRRDRRQHVRPLGRQRGRRRDVRRDRQRRRRRPARGSGRGRRRRPRPAAGRRTRSCAAGGLPRRRRLCAAACARCTTDAVSRWSLRTIRRWLLAE